MAVDPLSAGITAGASLLGGLFGAASEKEKQKKQLEAQGMQVAAEGAGKLGENQQKAFQSILDSYKSAFIR